MDDTVHACTVTQCCLKLVGLPLAVCFLEMLKKIFLYNYYAPGSFPEHYVRENWLLMSIFNEGNDNYIAWCKSQGYECAHPPISRAIQLTYTSTV